MELKCSLLLSILILGAEIKPENETQPFQKGEICVANFIHSGMNLYEKGEIHPANKLYWNSFSFLFTS